VRRLKRSKEEKMKRSFLEPGWLASISVKGWTRILSGGLVVLATVSVAACSGGAAPVTAPTSVPAAPTKAAAAPTTAGAAPAAAAPTTAIVSAKELTGAGATFPNPLYSKWFDVYSQKFGVKINYQAVGSGAGIQQITQRTVDFGASDAPMTDDQLKAAGAEILHIPTTMGPAVVTYNLQGVATGLKLSGDAVAGIFLGTITKWSDPKIAADNAGVKLPDSPITVVHRSDGSGTTNIFTDYLSAVSPEWKSKVGVGTSVNWPVGLGGKGNDGVAAGVKDAPGAVGYVELAYAVQNKLPYAFIKNQAGQFIEPSLDSVTAAAAALASKMPADLRVSIVNAPGDNSYPISGYTYILVYKDQTDGPKGKALVDFLWWAVHDGESYTKDLLYAPLPSDVVAKDEVMIKAITFQGKPLYQ
jgi:phosphate transport system substrate-binding protein